MQAPEDTIRSFSALLSEGDLNALVDLYEPEAAFVPRPGTIVNGHDEIRESLRPFLAMQPRMSGDRACGHRR
jgi:ketosteroid isomerase-like protein